MLWSGAIIAWGAPRPGEFTSLDNRYQSNHNPRKLGVYGARLGVIRRRSRDRSESAYGGHPSDLDKEAQVKRARRSGILAVLGLAAALLVVGCGGPDGFRLLSLCALS